MKKIWITSLSQDPELVQKVIIAVRDCGLAANGHFWVDDLKNMAWTQPLQELRSKETALWVVLGNAEFFQRAPVSFGLSLLALAVQSSKGIGFPILLATTGGEIGGKGLPTPLRGAVILSLGEPRLGAKVAALAHMPSKNVEAGYHLHLHPLPGIGLWFEVGPSQNWNWEGAMLGVNGGEIDFHGVGPVNGVPERATLEYPFQGMKIRLKEKEFMAWGVKNKLDSSSSYYVRIRGMPSSVLFGPYPGEDDPELHVLDLC
jgi:hypothetical protein